MFALDGLNPRSWTAADRASVAYLLWQRSAKASNDGDALRELFTLTDDHAALGALDREIMGQTAQVEVQPMGVRRG